MKLCKTISGRFATHTAVMLLLLTGCSGPLNDPPDSAVTGDNDQPMSEEQERPGSAATADAGKKVEPAARSFDMMALAAQKMNGSIARESFHDVPASIRWPVEPLDRENYAHLAQNVVHQVSESPVSTFSIDVDTGAYSNVRRFLNGGSLPPQDAVRVEELINYFSYADVPPRDTGTPFSVTTEAAPAPWNQERILLRIGIKGYEVAPEQRSAANLVFLIDVSGSMHDQTKLPLLKNSLQLLTRQLTARDRVSMVVYAGSSGVVLEPTPGSEQVKIISALDRLQAGGSTNGASGIRLAYQMAEQGYIEDGINRVLLATDGDFNVGTVNFEALVDIVERRRAGGIALTTLGFGAGNYNDHLMEQLADAGNGNHAYIDTLNEGRKVLVEQISGTLQTIAKDVKIQVEFNPAIVAEYRLIGYENRMLRREDFNNDQVDAGEIGAGHSVTALYELALTDSPDRLIEPLRYGAETAPQSVDSGELAFVRLRYKAPDEESSRLLEQPVPVAAIDTLTTAGQALRFAAAVAAFGELLRGSQYVADFTYSDVAELAAEARGKDPFGYRGEFLGLVRLAESLSASPRQASR